MSPRDSFWFLAGVLVAVAIMVTVRAWLRERPALGEAPVRQGESPSNGRPAGRRAIPSFAVPVAAGLALVGVALGIYFLLGSPDSIASAQAATATQPPHDTQMSSATAGSLDDVTNKLAARLATAGGSDNDWKLLAESYEYMGRKAEADAARAHVASAAATAGAAAMAGGAGDPTGGQTTGDQIADIDNALDKPHAQGKGQDKGKGNSSVNTAGNAEISGTVDINSKLARQAGSGATLFIYAKQPNAAGPPLAVLRVRAEHWPVSFTLNDGNAMVPGRNLSTASTVQIEARISKNGDALPRSGDLVGTVTSVNPRDGHPVKISIDREIG